MALPPFVRPLQQSAGLRRLWPGQVGALLAAELHLVVIAWLALELTGSGVALGTVLGIGLLPRIIFTLIGGVAADRVGHRRILFVGNAVRATVVAGLATVTVLGLVQVWHLYVVGLLLGSVTAFYTPAIFSAVPRECRPEDLRAGNALMRGTAEAAGVIGPVAGGVLVAWVGTGSAMWVTAALYAIATGLMSVLLQSHLAGDVASRAPSPPAGTGWKSLVRDVTEGIAVARRDPFLLRVLILIAVSALALSGPLTVGIPWLARQDFGVGAASFGLLLSMWTVGSLVGVILAGSVTKVPSWRVLIGLLSIVLTGALATLGLVRDMPVAAVCLLLMGTAAGAFNIFLTTWLQERTDPARLARLMSLAEVAELVASPASYLLAGLLLEVSVALLFLGSAAVFLLGAAVVLLGRQPPPQTHTLRHAP